MRIIFIVLIFFVQKLSAQSKIYNLEATSLDNEAVSFKSYEGRKILIAISSPDKLQKDGLKFLDSIQALYSSVQVLAIPTQDSTSSVDSAVLQSLGTNKTKRTIVTSPSAISREKLQQQSGIVKFLTDVKENTHFNNDVNSEFQLYFINESGDMYAVLERVDLKLLDELLHQQEIKTN